MCKVSNKPILPIDVCGSPPSKVCRICQKEKSLSEFPTHKHHKDNLDSRCRSCIKSHMQTVKNLKQTSPPKPSDNCCQCCGCNLLLCKPPRIWCLDHDDKTGKFRGWICNRCNLGIGTLGDTLEDVMNAVRYLSKDNPVSNILTIFEENNG